jgi:hypothetical protein
MNVQLNKYAAVGHSCVDLKMEVYYLNRQNKSSFLKTANLLNASLETICLHLPDPCMADARGIGSVCAEYRRAFIESRLWRNASRERTTCGWHTVSAETGTALNNFV